MTRITGTVRSEVKQGSFLVETGVCNVQLRDEVANFGSPVESWSKGSIVDEHARGNRSEQL